MNNEIELAKNIVDEIDRRQTEKEKFCNLALSLQPGISRLLRKERGFWNYWFKTKEDEIIEMSVDEAIRRLSKQQ